MLERRLRGQELPAYVPGEPASLAARAQANTTSPLLLAELGRLYGVARWDLASYLRLVILGALASWRPGSRIEGTAHGLRVVSPGCPLLDAARLDPRVCHMCQYVQEDLARQAAPEDVQAVRFDALVARGDPACVMTITTRKEETTWV